MNAFPEVLYIKLMKHVKAQEFFGDVVHHHESCLKMFWQRVAIVGSVNVDEQVSCTCDEVPSIDELNSLLEV